MEIVPTPEQRPDGIMGIPAQAPVPAPALAPVSLQLSDTVWARWATEVYQRPEKSKGMELVEKQGRARGLGGVVVVAGEPIPYGAHLPKSLRAGADTIDDGYVIGPDTVRPENVTIVASGLGTPEEWFDYAVFVLGLEVGDPPTSIRVRHCPAFAHLYAIRGITFKLRNTAARMSIQTCNNRVLIPGKHGKPDLSIPVIPDPEYDADSVKLKRDATTAKTKAIIEGGRADAKRRRLVNEEKVAAEKAARVASSEARKRVAAEKRQGGKRHKRARSTVLNASTVLSDESGADSGYDGGSSSGDDTNVTKRVDRRTAQSKRTIDGIPLHPPVQVPTDVAEAAKMLAMIERLRADNDRLRAGAPAEVTPVPETSTSDRIANARRLADEAQQALRDLETEEKRKKDDAEQARDRETKAIGSIALIVSNIDNSTTAIKRDFQDDVGVSAAGQHVRDFTRKITSVNDLRSEYTNPESLLGLAVVTIDKYAASAYTTTAAVVTQLEQLKDMAMISYKSVRIDAIAADDLREATESKFKSAIQQIDILTAEASRRSVDAAEALEALNAYQGVSKQAASRLFAAAGAGPSMEHVPPPLLTGEKSKEDDGGKKFGAFNRATPGYKSDDEKVYCERYNEAMLESTLSTVADMAKLPMYGLVFFEDKRVLEHLQNNEVESTHIADSDFVLALNTAASIIYHGVFPRLIKMNVCTVEDLRQAFGDDTIPKGAYE